MSTASENTDCEFSPEIKMNSVHSLIEEPFCGRSLSDRIETKRLGRPTPDLNIVQIVTCKKRSFNRKFNRDVYEKNSWICGCDIRNALFCFPCLLFGGEQLWTRLGLTDLNHLGDRTKKHAGSAQHMKNVVQFTLFGRGNDATQLDTAYRRDLELHNEKVRHNRHILHILINCVRFCGAFELASREHDESLSSSNPGVFGELINFSAELDVALKEHLEKAIVFQGTSTIIQNEILQAMFSVCQEEISREIEEGDYLSVIVDETSDVSSTFQMALVFRYIVNGKPVERFWDLLAPSDYSTKTLSSVILAELEKHVKGNKKKLVSQTYDGAALLNGAFKGVQTIVKETYGYATYIHCYAHKLNLVMLNAASANKKYKKDILDTMQKVVDETSNVSTINQATGYIKILTSKSFVFWLGLFRKIMPHETFYLLHFN
ncbi:hypothetical protein NQ318_023325 [Aromia moschata]|uniref:DUF4371 domain-containing protein n=1 Tax=Aromia moschata TaxID=1265417 RepID=A0AAV8XSR5_9CUCU|nr:hypothetical protein NQ318_023325 [Aromia moschata]